MAKNVIIMIGDGMGWEMARTAAIYKQIQDGKTGATLNDFYTKGEGTGLNFQTLTGYGLVTTYGTTIADSNGVFSTGNSALDGTDPDTGESPVRAGFQFNPAFNPGTTASGGAKVSDGAVGNLVGYDPIKGGINPWTPGTDREYIKNSYPDSANTATTLYTGVKSYNNAIGVDIFEDPLESILATATGIGKSTGLVSSVPIDHATPGAAAANVNRRNKYDADFPSLDNILQQELRVYQPTVILGGGHPLSTPGDPLPVGVEPNTSNEFIGKDTYKELSTKPTTNRYDYTFLERGQDAAQKLADTAATLDPEKGDRLLGLYGARGQNGNLPVSSANGDYSTTGLDMFSVFANQGDNAKVDTKRPLKPGETDAQFIATERNQNPTLNDLTKAALNVLGKDPDGFWLMIEGGDIDWSAHDDNIDNLIGTTLDFDKSVGSVIDWINKNGGWEENLLIVTADHDHYLTLNPEFPTLLQTKGAQALTDLDKSSEVGHYWGSDPNVKYGWGSHSNRPVPVYYQGAGSEVLDSLVGKGYEAYGYQIPGIQGLNDQTHIYQTMLASITEADQGKLVSGTVAGETLIAGVDLGGVHDTVFTGAGNDEVDLSFYNNARQNRINTGSGDDIIYVSRKDRAFGGSGDDIFDATDAQGGNRLSGGDGDDIFYLGKDDRASGGNGNDKFYVQSGGGNLIVGDAGADQFWIVSTELPATANTIVDFQIGIDVIGFLGSKSLGISASTLKLNQVGDNTDIAFNGKTLAVLNDIQASSLNLNSSSQFVFA
ncbi:alkaline phosphatase [Calothrix sp. PCC 7507]|uniref:alkaline phosphatase n=1 Tax=Calothrix sp. PCC 7507 TaxID=99598 RepID=UPI0002D5ADC0|nr:alkaline phosphatase [Calothrix sp. PCC 7507]